LLTSVASRSKISNDPQNTTWANNTERFGHKILTSQGWTPGASLGATDAAHKAHYTAASHSHIRVFLKDDNLGLGAKRGSERAENFGLAGFASILGRLNGKEEEVKKEEERQEKIQQRAYVYQKFGMMNFVSGGYLVGDKIEKGVKKEIEVKLEVKSEPESSDSEVVEKKSKKRKRSGEGEVKQEEEEPKLKRKKKSVSLREEAAKEDAALEAASKLKKDKKSKSASETPATDSEPLSDKARRKAEKRARKEEKKLKKALKKAAKEAAKSNLTTEDTSSESEEEEESTPASSVPASGISTPSGLTYNPRGMHAVRQRYIRQKKMASMDPQALKEVCCLTCIC
jgi:Pin2-interacting protein X1